MKLSVCLGQRKQRDGSPGNYDDEFDGRRCRSLGTKDRDIARRTYRQIEREYVRGEVADITGECRTTLGESRDAYVKLKDGIHRQDTFRAYR